VSQLVTIGGRGGGSTEQVASFVATPVGQSRQLLYNSESATFGTGAHSKGFPSSAPIIIRPQKRYTLVRLTQARVGGDLPINNSYNQIAGFVQAVCKSNNTTIATLMTPLTFSGQINVTPANGQYMYLPYPWELRGDDIMNSPSSGAGGRANFIDEYQVQLFLVYGNTGAGNITISFSWQLGWETYDFDQADSGRY
jgi:hypothetical protein